MRADLHAYSGQLAKQQMQALSRHKEDRNPADGSREFVAIDMPPDRVTTPASVEQPERKASILPSWVRRAIGVASAPAHDIERGIPSEG